MKNKNGAFSHNGSFSFYRIVFGWGRRESIRSFNMSLLSGSVCPPQVCGSPIVGCDSSPAFVSPVSFVLGILYIIRQLFCPRLHPFSSPVCVQGKKGFRLECFHLRINRLKRDLFEVLRSFRRKKKPRAQFSAPSDYCYLLNAYHRRKPLSP